MATSEQSLTPHPNVKWDGSKDFKFKIAGFSDLHFGKDPEMHKSVSGWAVFLNGAPILMRSKMQDCTTLSVVEAELVAATACAQDMLFLMQLLESIGLMVQELMVLMVDRKGAKDLVNNWSVGGGAHMTYYGATLFLERAERSGVDSDRLATWNQ